MNTVVQAPPPPETPDVRYLTDPEERKWSILAHAVALTGILVPITNILSPLIVWMIKKDELPLAAEQAKEAVNFNITVILVALACLFLTILGIGVPLLILLGIAWVGLTVTAIVSVGGGHPYRYPFTLRLV